jgi:ABC-type oligopeptide transport system ATPase subunit
MYARLKNMTNKKVIERNKVKECYYLVIHIITEWLLQASIKYKCRAKNCP